MECLVCSRIQEIKENRNPYFVCETETGYVVIGDFQLFYGYTVFICKVCAQELHELDPAFRQAFLRDMAQVAEAVFRAFQPVKLNYELIGSGNSTHIHWHLIPRRKEDAAFPAPVWTIPKTTRCGDNVRPSADQLADLRAALKRELLKAQGSEVYRFVE